MTSAKPQSMAAQTDAPDDLIAELARLMADDAASDQGNRAPAPSSDKPAPIRIPGAAETPAAAANPPPIRIPGQPANQRPERQPDAFNFDFAFKKVPTPASGPTTPLTPAVEPVFAAPPQPVTQVAETEVQSEALDFDGLADLIAAELATDLTPEPPLPPADGPARAEDNFGVPPVFGLSDPAGRSTTPQPSPVAPEPTPEPVEVEAEPVAFEPEPEPQPEPIPVAPEPVAPVAAEPRQNSDALTDIERLLAPVVKRAEVKAEAARAPSPALRSLATPTLPVVEPVVATPPKNRSIEPGSVDDAILAAAAATGARIDWVEAEGGMDRGFGAADDVNVVPPRPRRQFVMSRAVAGPLVAVGLLAAAGFGLYWVLGQNGSPTGPAPLLVADESAVKSVPDPVESTTQQSVVFNEISGGGNVADEQIVPRDQADQDALSEVANTGLGPMVSDDGTGIDPNQDGLVNRKVRTVTVRPDGTIISSTGGMAGSTILPVERPNVPEVPGADTSTPDLIASTIAAAEDATPAAPAAEATPVPAVPVVEPGAVVPVVDASGAALAGRTVTIPMQRPADFAQMAAGALSASAVPASGGNGTLTAPAAAQPAASAVNTATGGASAYVQLASQRSEEAARQSAQSMATRFGVLFGGASPEIQRADLGERGIYYRVLVPAPSREAAANICTNIRAAGGDCLLP
jgi:hypothetical protein